MKCVVLTESNHLLSHCTNFFCSCNGSFNLASEWRRIHAPAWKKIAFTLTFPLFMLTYLPISLAALFMKVEWKPIHHSVNLTSLPSPAVKN